MADLDRKNDVFVTKDNKEKNADFSEKTVNIHVDAEENQVNFRRPEMKVYGKVKQPQPQKNA